MELERSKAEVDKLTKEKMALTKQIEKEKEICDLKSKEIQKNLEEVRVIQEKINDMRSTLDKEKNAVISKETEFQHLIKENEKLQSNFQASQKYNCILLSRNSSMHSAMQELQIVYNKANQLKEEVQRLKIGLRQNLEEFIQTFAMIQQKVEEESRQIMELRNKVNQDCSSVMCECAEITKKLNATLHRNRCLMANQNGTTAHALSPTNLASHIILILLTSWKFDF